MPAASKQLRRDPLDRVEDEKSLFEDAFVGRMFKEALSAVAAAQPHGVSADAQKYLLQTFNKAATTVTAEQRTGAHITIEAPLDPTGVSPLYQRYMGHSKALASNCTVTLSRANEGQFLVRTGRAATRVKEKDIATASVDLLDVESIAAVSHVRQKRAPTQRKKAAPKKAPRTTQAQAEQNVDEVLNAMGLLDMGVDDGGDAQEDDDMDMGFV